MSHPHVCPWWIGYLLASPVRRLFQKPEPLLAPFVTTGMCVLEVGPGMGFFTLPAARMAGPDGKVFAVDIQGRMLRELRMRADAAGLSDRIECRLTGPETPGIGDLREIIDFTLLLAVVHEVPDVKRLFTEIRMAMKPGGKARMADPKSHYSRREFDRALAAARDAGFDDEGGRPAVWRSWTAVLLRR